MWNVEKATFLANVINQNKVHQIEQTDMNNSPRNVTGWEVRVNYTEGIQATFNKQSTVSKLFPAWQKKLSWPTTTHLKL
jgi:hypothetical protein